MLKAERIQSLLEGRFGFPISNNTKVDKLSTCFFFSPQIQDKVFNAN